MDETTKVGVDLRFEGGKVLPFPVTCDYHARAVAWLAALESQGCPDRPPQEAVRRCRAVADDYAWRYLHERVA